ncbi:MAG: M23 family metallopeptidase, partial [Anaerolineae bacterium]|nr:M23 family metallopeptidase [Anaerolineae bacterium]
QQAVLAEGVQAPASGEQDATSGRVQWMQCWIERTGLPPSQISAAIQLLGSGELVADVVLRLPERLARTTLLGTGGTHVSPEALVAYEVPAWRILSYPRLASGQPLSLTQGADACLPYPVTSIAMSSQPMIRGRTAALIIETDRLAFCRATYLGQEEGCYRDGTTRLVVLVGISALIDPGTYPLRIELVSGGEEVAFSVPLEVVAGSYGFQYIDPPPQLSGLMDAELMSSEARYLEQWRGVSSSTRQWNLPLALPLASWASVSADYGDRRSYGGMVSGYHSGIDYRAWTGLGVVAPADGLVIMAEELTMRGNAVLIDHGWGLVTGYWHLSRTHVQVGDVVTRGSVFAEVGSTGLSTGSHLHWEVWVNGVSVDGKQLLMPNGLAGIKLSPLVGSDHLGSVE